VVSRKLELPIRFKLVVFTVAVALEAWTGRAQSSLAIHISRLVWRIENSGVVDPTNRNPLLKTKLGPFLGLRSDA
jgi:hypothetical protein